ncbi:amylo-alpha-1,6-glucosidase [Micrococcales bacterium 31B]|nr:amylo-alpha-1,6-glucosidase [Micrococcales bacterium 31B]
MVEHIQPLLHDLAVTIQAPVQAWSSRGGDISPRATYGGSAQGVYLADARVISRLEATVGGHSLEGLSHHQNRDATGPGGTPAQSTTFTSLARALDGPGADPTLTLTRTRTVTSTGVRESFTLASACDFSLDTTLDVDLDCDFTRMDVIKGGASDAPLAGSVSATPEGAALTVTGPSGSVRVLAQGGTLASGTPGAYRVTWPVTVEPGAAVTVTLDIEPTETGAVVCSPTAPALTYDATQLPDDRLRRFVEQSTADLSGLRLDTPSTPGHPFFAAGAPWFFTLFGRDSLIAARFALRAFPEIARGTLATLAARQGTRLDPETAEAPGKILHEIRAQSIAVLEEGFSLPPVYYGTIDATPLWVLLLADAHAAGQDEATTRSLLPHLQRALDWMVEYGDSDGDGLLEYIDETGSGLANQGWKDSGDSVRHRDGSLAEGPIALVEVQAYAYEAALRGADLLDEFGIASAHDYRAWAATLKARFNASFWVENELGRYPAIALDAHKVRVESLTSNIGHIVASGIVDAAGVSDICAALAHPSMDSGFGLRTLSSENGGYWPLRYHAGAVWTHDTAFVIVQLARAAEQWRESDAAVARTCATTARGFIEGLLAAAPHFGYRLPELFGGQAASEVAAPVPYPASCWPQAWAAASAFALVEALGRLGDAP